MIQETNRIHKLRTQFESLGIQALLITNRTNTRYISGFTGSNSLIYLSAHSQIIITDFRYIEQATQQCSAFSVVNQGEFGLIGTAMAQAEKEGITKLGFESAHTNYDTYKLLSDYGIDLVPVTNTIEKLRQIKSADEIEKLKKAEAIGDVAFEKIIPYIRDNYKQGLTEKDIALEIERIMRQNGATGNSFNPIVAAGKKSSLCHATPGDACLHEGDFVVMDFGCVYEGYCSDMTRTIVIGKASEKHLTIYNTVLQAQLQALAAIKPGMKGKEVDAVARDIIKEAGYGDYFGHGLGHSVGMDIHENPRFSQAEEQEIEVGMALTVEPGIYVPGFGGVRIEDMIVVTEEGYINLTHSPKELVVIE